jgi:preprotein translocase subunit SecE
VARDRKRAKQRRARRGRGDAAAAPAGSPVRVDVPGALDHASGDVDEFDAALVRGAGGVPVTPDASPDAETELEAEPDADEPDVEPDAGSEDRLQTDALSGGGSSGGGSSSGGGAGSGGDGGGAVPDRPSGAPLRGGNRAVGFIRASWAELQRVQWPDRPQVFQATAVVLGFVAIAGAYLGLADFVAKEIVEFVL